MKRFIFCLGLSLAILGSSVVYAGGSSDYSRNGVYIGAGGMYAIENFSDTGGLSFDDSAGFNFRLGYRLHPHIAIEAEGERAIGFDLKQATLDIETWMATLNAKVFAFTGRIQPFGIIGIGAMNAKADSPLLISSVNETDLAFRFGGGSDFYVTKNWVVNLEGSYVLPTGDVQDVNYISLGGGLQYRF